MTITRHCAFLAVALTAASLAACAPEQQVDEPESLMLLDDEAVPRSSELRRIHEQPTFPVDQQQRPYGMLADQQDRPASAREGPIRLDEARTP